MLPVKWLRAWVQERAAEDWKWGTAPGGAMEKMPTTEGQVEEWERAWIKVLPLRQSNCDLKSFFSPLFLSNAHVCPCTRTEHTENWPTNLHSSPAQSFPHRPSSWHWAAPRHSPATSVNRTLKRGWRCGAQCFHRQFFTRRSHLSY